MAGNSEDSEKKKREYESLCVYCYRRNIQQGTLHRQRTDFPHERFFPGGTFVTKDQAKNNAFLKFATESAQRDFLTDDRTKFLVEDYPAKRKEIGIEIVRVMDELMSAKYPPHLRNDWVEALSYVSLVEQLWSFTIAVLSDEQKLGIYAFLPCPLVDCFIDFLPILEHIESSKNLCDHHFLMILDLRDECVKSIQWFYRVCQPILENKPVKFPASEEDFVRYNPYDSEWLCGVALCHSDANLDCVKYLVASRMNQLELLALRLDVISESYGRNTEFNKSRDSWRPKKTDRLLLLLDLQAKEIPARLHHFKSILALKPICGTDPQYIYTRELEHFHFLRGKLRVDRMKLITEIIGAAQDKLRFFRHYVKNMGTCEAFFLIMEKIWAQAVDKRHGIYGQAFPVNVREKLGALVMNMKLDHPEKHDQAVAYGLIMEVRSALKDEVRRFYTVQEPNIEKFYTSAIDHNCCIGGVTAQFGVSEKRLPNSLGLRKKDMIWNLRTEQHENRRLLSQIAQVKRKRVYWPKDAPTFTMNTCGRDVVSIHCNFLDFFPKLVERIALDVKEITGIPPANERNFHEECAVIAGTIAWDQQCVPHKPYIVVAMREAFYDAISQTTRFRVNTRDLADRMSNALVHDINDRGWTWNRQMTHGVDQWKIAEKIAKIVIDHYLVFIESERQFKPPEYPDSDEDEQKYYEEEEEKDDSSPPLVHVNDEGFVNYLWKYHKEIVELEKARKVIRDREALSKRVPEAQIDDFLDNIARINLSGTVAVVEDVTDKTNKSVAPKTGSID